MVLMDRDSEDPVQAIIDNLRTSIVPGGFLDYDMQCNLLKTLVPLLSLSRAIDEGITISSKVCKWPDRAKDSFLDLLPHLTDDAPRLVLTLLQHAAVGIVDKADARTASANAICSIVSALPDRLDGVRVGFMAFITRMSTAPSGSHKTAAAALSGQLLLDLLPNERHREITDAPSPSHGLYNTLLRLAADDAVKAATTALGGLSAVFDAVLSTNCALCYDVPALLAHVGHAIHAPAPLVRRAAVIALHRLLLLLCPARLSTPALPPSAHRVALSRSLSRKSWMHFAEAVAVRCLDVAPSVHKAAIVALCALAADVLQVDPASLRPAGGGTVAARAAHIGVLVARYLLPLAPTELAPDVLRHMVGSGLLELMVSPTDPTRAFLESVVGARGVTPATFSSYMALLMAKMDATERATLAEEMSAALDSVTTDSAAQAVWAMLAALSRGLSGGAVYTVARVARPASLGRYLWSSLAVTAFEALLVGTPDLMGPQETAEYTGQLLTIAQTPDAGPGLVRAAYRLVGRLWAGGAVPRAGALAGMTSCLNDALMTAVTALAPVTAGEGGTGSARAPVLRLMECILAIDPSITVDRVDQIEAVSLTALNAPGLPHSLRSLILGTLASLCLVCPAAAPRHLPLFNMERQTAASPIVRATACVALTDLCLLDPGAAEAYILAMTRALTDPATLVRGQAVAMLGRLIVSGHVKVRTVVFFHVVRALADPDESTRDLARYVLGTIVAARDAGKVLALFIEAAFVLTGDCAGPFNTFPPSGAARRALAVPNAGDRARILVTLLNLIPESRVRLVTAKIITDVIRPAAAGDLPIDATSGALAVILGLLRSDRLYRGDACPLEALVALATTALFDLYRVARDSHGDAARLAPMVLLAIRHVAAECEDDEAGEAAMARAVAAQDKQTRAEYGNAEMLDIAGDEDAERVTHAKTPGLRFIANKTPGVVGTPGMSQLFMTPFPATQRTGRSRSQPVSFATPIIVPAREKGMSQQ